MTNPTTKSKTVCFNVGGKIYDVARSLLEQHPDTMLARLASETWAASDATIGNEGDKNDALFIERNSERFQYVLDYMRDGGVVKLPLTISMEAVLQDLAYYGFQDVDPSLITVAESMKQYQSFHKYMNAKIKSLQEEIEDDEMRLGCLKLVKYCLSHYLNDGSLTINVNRGAKTTKDFYCFAHGASCDQENTCRKLLDWFLEKVGFSLKDIQCRYRGDPVKITLECL